MATLDELPIIDVDSHYTEPADLWSSRAPTSLRDRCMRVVRDKAGNDRWVVDDDIELAPLGFTVIRKDGTKVYGRFSLEHYDEMTEASYDPAARLRVMDGFGIRAQVMYPNALGFAGHGVMRIKDETLRLFCITGYNDGVAEVQKQSGDRLLPQAVLPFWDIELCVAELRRSVEDLGLRGFTMTDSPEQWELPPLHDPHWDALWDTAQGLGVPCNFHIGAGTPMTGAWPGYDMPRMMAAMSLALFTTNMRCVTNLIVSGLLDRFPRLAFVSVESGVGWLPFVIDALDYQIDENMGAGRGGLELRPREYFQRQIYASYWFETRSLAPVIAALGEDNIMFETDFPHPTCLYPEVRKVVNESLDGQPERVQRKVLYETAARLYGVDLALLGELPR